MPAWKREPLGPDQQDHSRNNLGLQSMAQQASSNVTITGGTVSGVTVADSNVDGGSLMATQVHRNSLSDKVPTSLQPGELAANTTDGRVWIGLKNGLLMEGGGQAAPREPMIWC